MTAAQIVEVKGVRKVAILMIAVGEHAAATICKELTESEVQLIAREIAEIRSVTPDVTQQVVNEFHKVINEQTGPTAGGIEYASQMVTRSHGEEAARILLEQIPRVQELSARKLESLKKVDPQQLAKFLETEHPQTIALILAHLETKTASLLITKLPNQIRSEAVRRLAQLRQFSPEIAEQVSLSLNRRFNSIAGRKRQTFTGFKSVAELMNQLDSTTAKDVLQNIEEADPKLALNIRNLMFTFEDLSTLTEQAIRELLSHLDKKTLAMALKGASEELKTHIFRSMSSRAVQMLQEDMEALGPVRAKEVSAAHHEIVTSAHALEEQGKIDLRPEGDDEYIV